MNIFLIMSGNLGKAIKICRMQKGMKQFELASKSGMHQTTICRIEAGKSLPSMASFHAIARALGVSETHLYLLCLDSKDIKQGRLVDFIHIKKELKDMLIEKV